ncbi:hypothetical protein QNM99_23085 [Pseudomonas sp. PCH446]
MLWNEEPVGNSKAINPEDRPGDPLELYIPLDALVEGKYQLAYRVTDTFSQEHSDSFPCPSKSTPPPRLSHYPRALDFPRPSTTA